MPRPRSPASLCRLTAAGPPIDSVSAFARRFCKPHPSLEDKNMNSVSDSAARRAGEPIEQTAPGHRQIVLVFQGGGALGAYQAGVYQALHEAGIEPDWIIGTSIGAI